jgi:ABC-2 type transport system permease protein
MLRYLRLIKAFARYRIARELEFPANFLVSILIHLFFIGANLTFFSLIWLRVGGFGGLSPYEMLFFTGTFHLADSFYMVFTFYGIMEIPELVRRGDMDFLLSKPVPSQFLTTFRSFSMFSLVDLAMAVLLISYALAHLNYPITWHTMLIYLVMACFGAAISYALSCMVMTLSFTLIAVDAIWTAFFEMGEFERYPMGIYPPPWKTVFSIILPTVMVANFPAYFALGKLTATQLAWFFSASVLLVLLSHKLWQQGLKRYQSASS